MSTPPEWVQVAGIIITWSVAMLVAVFWQPRWVDRLVTRLIALMNELGVRRAWFVVVLLLQVLAAEVVLILTAAPPAHADPPPWSDPHYPDVTHSSCAGGRGGAFGFGWCDGEHYADGTYWHQVFGAGADLAKPHCVRDDGSGQPPVAPGGCGGYG